MEQNYGFCRYCNKQILWTRTTAGKAMPCDPTVITFTPSGGPETFVLPSGEVKRGMRSKDGERGYISHFATCPKAKAALPKSKAGRKATATAQIED